MPNPPIAKLPKWAQEQIKTLEYQRDAAVQSLNEFLDQQKPTDVWIEDHPITGEETGPTFKRRYLETNEVTFLIDGIEIHVRKTKHTIQAERPGYSLYVSTDKMQMAIGASNQIEVWSGRKVARNA